MIMKGAQSFVPQPAVWTKNYAKSNGIGGNSRTGDSFVSERQTETRAEAAAASNN
jgi:hypothetical protein